MDEEKTRPTGFPWPVAALSLCFIFSSAGPLSAEEAQHSVTLENRSGTAIVVKVIGPTLHIVEMTPEETASFNSKPGVYYLLLRYSTEPLHSYAKLGPFTAQQSSFARSVITIPQYSLVSEHAELSPIAAEEFDKAGRTFPFRVENKSSENVLVRILGPLHRQLTLSPGASNSVQLTSGAYRIRVRYGSDPVHYRYFTSTTIDLDPWVLHSRDSHGIPLRLQVAAESPPPEILAILPGAAPDAITSEEFYADGEHEK